MWHFRFMYRCFRILFLMVLATFTAAAEVSAQSFPSKPVTVILPYAVATSIDLVFRPIGAEVSKRLGQPVVVENRPGAQARLGLTAISRAAGDGYLLSMVSGDLVVDQPIREPDFKVAVGKDYAPVAFLVELPLVLATSASLPFRDVKSLVAFGKANPGKLNFALTPSSQSLAEKILRKADIQVTIIPFNSAPQSLVDLGAGRVDMTISSTSVSAMIDAGKAVGLATTGGKRWSAFPNLPTLSESGVPVIATIWFGIVAHPDTPVGAITKLNEAFNATLKMPEIQKTIEKHGMSIGSYATPAEFAAFIRSEIAEQASATRK